MKFQINAISLLLVIVFLVGCTGSGEQKDLTDYILETKKRPHGTIDPLPIFQPYKAFSYSSNGIRSPFDKPVPIDSTMKGGRAVEPDLAREKEFLEGFNISSLKMVGHVNYRGKGLQALIDDSQGDVKRVSVGNYLGKNFGKILNITEKQVELMEIVSDGSTGWIERPRVIKLEQKE